MSSLSYRRNESSNHMESLCQMNPITYAGSDEEYSLEWIDKSESNALEEIHMESEEDIHNKDGIQRFQIH